MADDRRQKPWHGRPAARLVARGRCHAREAGLLQHGEADAAANEALEPFVADDVLHRFIDAAHEIAAIRSACAERMHGASRLQRRLLRSQARNRIARALATAGLTHATYRAIGAVMECDAGLGQMLAGGRDAPVSTGG